MGYLDDIDWTKAAAGVSQVIGKRLTGAEVKQVFVEVDRRMSAHAEAIAKSLSDELWSKVTGQPVVKRTEILDFDQYHVSKDGNRRVHRSADPFDDGRDLMGRRRRR